MALVIWRCSSCSGQELCNSLWFSHRLIHQFWCNQLAIQKGETGRQNKHKKNGFMERFGTSMTVRGNK